MKRAFTMRVISHLFLLSMAASSFFLLQPPRSCGAELHPVVLVPGSGGNQLEARLTPSYHPSSFICRIWHGHARPGEWFRLWFDASVLVSPLLKCFSERMTLLYDAAADDYRNAPGVETRVPHFGSTLGLLSLDPNLKHVTEYMAPLVSSLQQLGYRDGDNLFGAPYDFRYGLAAEGHPCKMGSRFLQDLKQLIENASMANGGKPAIVLTHSLGSLFALHLLHRSPPWWRRKYVKHLVTLSAPWAGTAQEMLTFASGYSLDVPLVNPLLVRSEQRSSESNLWLLPCSKHFGHKPLVVTDGGRTYSSFDIPQFLKDIGFEEGVQPYVTRILPLVRQLPAPVGVPVTCIVGGGIKTVETLFYGSGGFDRQPNIVYGDGDGTVNTVSLLALQAEWSNASEKQQVKVIQMPQITHTSILKEEEALRKIKEEIMIVNSAYLTSPV